MLSEQERKARLAYAIRSAREKRGMTPPELAKALGVGRGTVNDWENGQKTAAPTILMLGPLCDALKVEPSLFAVLPPIPPSPVDDFLTEEATPGEEQQIRDVVRRRRSSPRSVSPSPDHTDGDH